MNKIPENIYGRFTDDKNGNPLFITSIEKKFETDVEYMSTEAHKTFMSIALVIYSFLLILSLALQWAYYNKG